ncbi:MAG TPA: MlaD family protein, partial [Vicinamibacterales bacterium]|nr:MlaD family protein [Vicinamibacterales bacterium]
MGVNRLAAVGVFVISGALLFAVGIFMIGDRRMLFVDTFRVYAEFATISGLANGATVRLSGLQAGEVEAIHVPAGPGSRFRVRMRIRGDLRNLVRLDSVASIQNDGLVGNKFVQIEVGTEESPVAPHEATIQSREPFDFADLLERLSDTVETVNQTILEVKDEVDSALEVISATAETAQNVMDDVGRGASRVLVTTNKITEDLQVVMKGVRDGRGTIGQLLTDDTLYQRAKAIAADAERTAATIRQASEEARTVIAEFRSQGGPIKGLAGDLQETLDAARV